MRYWKENPEDYDPATSHAMFSGGKTVKPKGQIIHKMSDKDYFAHPALNSSSAKELIKSPAHYKLSLDQVLASESLSVGSAWHCMQLQPERWDDLVEVDDKYKTWCQAIRTRQLTSNKAIISQNNLIMLNQMAISLDSFKPEIKELIRGAKGIEVVAIHKDPETGIEMKAKADIYNAEKISDLKTTGQIIGKHITSDKALKAFVEEWQYDFQAAWYMYVFSEATGITVKEFDLIYTEKGAPHGTATVGFSHTVLNKWLSHIRTALSQLKECQDSGVWPDYSNKRFAIEY